VNISSEEISQKQLLYYGKLVAPVRSRERLSSGGQTLAFFSFSCAGLLNIIAFNLHFFNIVAFVVLRFCGGSQK
jgi:hypothetical protein